jgi:protein translocase SecG subunit
LVASQYFKKPFALLFKFDSILSINMATLLPVLQIIISVLLIAGILLQNSSAGLGGAFGGSDNVDAGYHSRRGFEKWLFNGTIILAILFALISFLHFIIF